eukprot:5837331-Heterocapsa_arctica.AAC.1
MEWIPCHAALEHVLGYRVSGPRRGPSRSRSAISSLVYATPPTLKWASTPGRVSQTPRDNRRWPPGAI